jgi:hypothetical protein
MSRSPVRRPWSGCGGFKTVCDGRQQSGRFDRRLDTKVVDQDLCQSPISPIRSGIKSTPGCNISPNSPSEHELPARPRLPTFRMMYQKNSSYARFRADTSRHRMAEF